MLITIKSFPDWLNVLHFKQCCEHWSIWRYALVGLLADVGYWMLTAFLASESWEPSTGSFVTHLGFKGWLYIWGPILGGSRGRWVPVLACREGLLERLYFTFILKGDVPLALRWLQVVIKPTCFILRQITCLAELGSVTGGFKKLID